MSHYEKLIRKYKYKQEELIFTKEQVVDILLSKYKAQEFQKELILDLMRDDHFQYDKIFKCFRIDDPYILNKVFTVEEKKEHMEEINDNEMNAFDYSKSTGTDFEYNKMVLDEQEGRRIDIILESKDDTSISEFQVRHRSDKISSYLNALIVGALIQTGAAEYEEDTEDYYFKFYLDNLNAYGFLK
ncbi:hypothetical protein AB5N96_08105 [Chryseomicrobium imtechense]